MCSTVAPPGRRRSCSHSPKMRPSQRERHGGVGQTRAGCSAAAVMVASRRREAAWCRAGHDVNVPSCFEDSVAEFYVSHQTVPACSTSSIAPVPSTASRIQRRWAAVQLGSLFGGQPGAFGCSGRPKGLSAHGVGRFSSTPAIAHAAPLPARRPCDLVSARHEFSFFCFCDMNPTGE
jgi:hypothetical protein